MKDLKITNPDKILFPQDKIKKIDVINYYLDVCKIMLPFIKDRPLSVIKCHDNIDGEIFFKKHPTNDKDYVCTFKEGKEEYFYINKDYQLVFQAQNGTIEFHIGGGKAKSKKPDFMVLDLDPDEKLVLSKLRQAVKNVKSVLDELGLQSYLKTSGGKGYHIMVPFSTSKNWDSFYTFSKNLAEFIENKWQDTFTTNIKKVNRKGKIFIDYLRNNQGSTCVAPYSLRARKGASISFPIAWEDLDKIKPNQINIKNYKKYINNFIFVIFINFIFI